MANCICLSTEWIHGAEQRARKAGSQEQKHKRSRRPFYVYLFTSNTLPIRYNRFR